MQLNITKAHTPDTLTLRIHQDPFDPEAPLSVSAQVWSVDGSVVAAHHVSLKGLEADFLDTVVSTAVDCWRWGAPQSQLKGMLSRVARLAREHRKAQGG